MRNLTRIPLVMLDVNIAGASLHESVRLNSPLMMGAFLRGRLPASRLSISDSLQPVSNSWSSSPSVLSHFADASWLLLFRRNAKWLAMSDLKPPRLHIEPVHNLISSMANTLSGRSLQSSALSHAGHRYHLKPQRRFLWNQLNKRWGPFRTISVDGRKRQTAREHTVISSVPVMKPILVRQLPSFPPFER